MNKSKDLPLVSGYYGGETFCAVEGGATVRVARQEPEEKVAIIPKGRLFIVTSGEYSDYHWVALFRALKRIVVDEALQERFLTANPEMRKPYVDCDHAFAAWLAKEGYAETVDCTELYLDDERQGLKISVTNEGP